MATRGPALERDGGETTARAELALNYGHACTGRPHARSWRSTSKACFIECVRCTQLSDGAAMGRIAVGEVEAFGRARAYRVGARGFCAFSNEGSRRVLRGDDACRQKEAQHL